MKTKLTAILIGCLITGSTIAAPSPSPSPEPDTLKNAVADVITKATATVGDAKDFVLAQLPDVVKQLLAWKLAMSLIECISGLLLLIFIVSAWVRTVRYGKREDWGEDDWFTIAFIGAIATVILGGIGAALINFTWLEIWIAPKVFLIDYAKTIIDH